jgi:hypothetical protein
MHYYSRIFSRREKSLLFGHFTQFEISVPLQGNKNRGEVFPDGSTNKSWFLPDGVNANFGYGFHFNKWIGISANSGIGMKISEKLVMSPVFSNLRFMPKIGADSRIGIDIGLGKTFAIGRGDLTGDFKRLKVNVENDDIQIFIEIVNYGINIHDSNKIGSISIGIATINF